MVCNPEWKPMVNATTDWWVKETIIFLQSHNLDLCRRIETPLLCNNDDYLMVYWTKHGATTHQLERLNRCRLYLQVLNISELVSGDGKSLLRHYYEGEKGLGTQQYHCPNQNRPSTADWNIWKEWLNLLITTPNSLKLRQPSLGLQNGNGKQWQWRYDPQTDTLFHKPKQEITAYDRARMSERRQRRTGYTTPPPPVRSLTAQAKRTNVWTNHQYHTNGTREKDPLSTPASTTISHFFETQPDNTRWIWEQH
jgi:hypothetical protein